MSDQKITLNLIVGESIETDTPGAFRTSLTHPEFAGELWIIHGEKDLDKLLELKNENILAGAVSIAESLQKLSNCRKKKRHET